MKRGIRTLRGHFAWEKLPVASFSAKCCAVRYRKAKPLGGQVLYCFHKPKSYPLLKQTQSHASKAVSLYFVGDISIFFLKNLENASTSSNPTDVATSVIDILLFFNSSHARFIRKSFKYFLGEIFSCFINKLYKYLSLI